VHYKGKMQKYDRWLSDSYAFFVPEKSSLKPILGQFFLILMGITAMWVKSFLQIITGKS
jgi:hypothetical protein